MSDQDLNVSTGLMVGSQQSDEQPQQQVVHLMLQDQSGGSLVHHIVDSSMAPHQLPTSSGQIQQLKVKKPVAPSVSQKELSKQWKVLCKKAKEWCSLHGSYTPSFVMMYLDDNKLVWEGPDHMESFISDENVISAFLRTAVSTVTTKDKSSGGRQTGYDETYMDTGHQNVSEAESTVVQALEQLGQMQPAQGSHTQSTHYVTASGSRTATEDCPDAGDCDESDHDEDSSDVKMTVQEDGSDVLSEVIDSVIKEWEPGQDTRRCRGKIPPKSSARLQHKRHLSEVQETKSNGEGKQRKRRRHAFKLPGTGTNVRLVRSSQPVINKKSARRREKVACPHCGKIVSRNNLSAHVRLHRTDLVQEHVCSVCNKGFIKARDLKIHLTVHTGERPHKCQVCFKAFRLKVTMDEHMLTHTGEKPHACSYCNRPFARRSDLRCHIRLHTGEKPYMCNHCGRRFSLSCNYNAHLRTHTGDQKRVFGPCNTCGQSFTNRKSYREHQRSHEVQVVQPVSSQNNGQLMLQTHLQNSNAPGSIIYHPQTHHTGLALTADHALSLQPQSAIPIQQTLSADTVYYNLG